MTRLRCGTILLNGFLDHIAESACRAPEERVVTLEYIKCAAGAQAGQQWARLGSTRRHGLPADCLFEADGVTVCMSPQTQRGLRDKWVDFRDGQLVVG